ncbi:nucleotidyltransferase family protein [Candidatus Micrarchaeota archaeon]|nr:nucleotidyltransferase family protein [Candidatus Micrarchaeota archaeon]
MQARKAAGVKRTILGIIAAVLAIHGAKKASLFGSYARGEQKPGGDIDVIVEFEGRKSLMELVRIENELSDKVGRKVDLLTEKSISPYIAERIAGEMKALPL